MGDWESPLRNVNRGYRKLTVWQDAVDYYVLTCRLFRDWPYELRRVGSNQIASVDSIHRNIAEGYCRRSIKLENGLKRLIESLQVKRDAGAWDESFVVRESNAAYGGDLFHE